MTTPIWVLLGFAAWTLLLLLGTVGAYRWSRILTGRAPISGFRADRPEGPDWYRRAMRAHANCVENLPVYGAVALAGHASGVTTPTLDALASVFLGARVLQSLVHVAFVETDRSVAARFTFFLAQIVCVVAMGVQIASRAHG